jgi:hypothetical protein
MQRSRAGTADKQVTRAAHLQYLQCPKVGPTITEADWLASTDPQRMLGYLRGRASDRKLRLFTVACCRRIWHRLEDERSREAVLVAERFADGLATERERSSAADRALMAVDVNAPRNHPDAVWGLAVEAERCAAYADPREVESQVRNGRSCFSPKSSILNAHCDLLRDIFGNQFHSRTIHPGWRSQRVLELARVIYTERSFDKMPLLCDALEQAGCSDPATLAHCREPRLHVRGCWVVDVLLGKA